MIDLGSLIVILIRLSKLLSVVTLNDCRSMYNLKSFYDLIKREIDSMWTTTFSSLIEHHYMYRILSHTLGM